MEMRSWSTGADRPSFFAGERVLMPMEQTTEVVFKLSDSLLPETGEFDPLVVRRGFIPLTHANRTNEIEIRRIRCSATHLTTTVIPRFWHSATNAATSSFGRRMCHRSVPTSQR